MNVSKLTAGFDVFCERLGPALMASDVWGHDRLSIASFNPQPAAVALFGEITARLTRALADSGFPKLGRYYLLELEGKKLVCVMMYKDYQWGCLVDMTKINMGMVISVAVPKAVEDLQASVDS